MKKLWFVVLLIFLCPKLYAQTPQWAGILAPSRAINWTNAGVTGGIPSGSWSQCVTAACQTVTTSGASSTAAQIGAALSSAPKNSYVLLPAGTYNLSGAIPFSGLSSVALRGSGANQTVLVFTGGNPGINVSGGGGSNQGSPVLVSGNVSQGSNTITLASVPSLKIGNPIILDQSDTTNDNGGVLVLGSGNAYSGPFTAPGNAGPYSIDGEANNIRCPGGHDVPSNCFHQQQIVFVTSCNGVTTAGTACSGTNVSVGINPPLHMSNWSTANNMSAWWDTAPVQYDGVEDLTVDTTNDPGADNVYLSHCSNCWIKGITSIDGAGIISHVVVQYSANDSVVNSYFFLTKNHVTSSYGVNCSGGSDLLVQNNIFQAVASPVIWNGGCSGSVVGYNYNINNFYTTSTQYNQNFYGEHAAGIDMTLIEGNVANYADTDNIHGTSNLNTFFRNVFAGPLPACWASGSTYATATFGPCTNGLSPIYFLAYHRFMNSIGNVLGTSGQNTAYQIYESESGANAYVYVIGFGDTVPNDPNIQTTGMFWGNCDSATGFNACRFNSSEVPSALTGVQATYSNPVPSSQALPASFYNTSTPAWWPSGKPFPPIGPDVSSGNALICTSGTYSRAWVNSASLCSGGSSSVAWGGRANSIPAMDCYLGLGGNPYGTGPVLTNFNESACYSQSTSIPPQPPTNVKATAQ
jgi:hypothetical protein